MKTTQTFKISHYNCERGADELIVYDRGGQPTGTNAYGIEAVCVCGMVTECSANNVTVPLDGFVLSGHGAAEHFLAQYAPIGAKISIDTENMTVTATVDDESRIYACKKRIFEIKQRISEREFDDASFDKPATEQCLQRLSNLMNKRTLSDAEFNAANDILDEAYARTAYSSPSETRAVWHRPLEETKEQIWATVERLADIGFNLLLVETIYEGFSICKRVDGAPLRVDLVGKDFDMLDEFIAAGKQYGVRIHAWVEDFFVGIESSDKSVTSGSPIIDQHPEWAARLKDGSIYMKSEQNFEKHLGFMYINAAIPACRDYLYGMYKQLLDNYPLDGLQLDYIRYPLSTSVDDSVGFDDFTVTQVINRVGIDIRNVKSVNEPEWKMFVNWRAMQITTFVERINRLVAEYKKSGRKLKLSTAVFGNPVESLNKKCQNWEYWLSKQWLDFISPMAYYHHSEDVFNEVKHMVDKYGTIPNIAGISPMYGKLPIIESTKQIEAARRAGAKGIAFFETKAISDRQAHYLKIGAFRR